MNESEEPIKDLMDKLLDKAEETCSKCPNCGYPIKVEPHPVYVEKIIAKENPGWKPMDFD